MSCMTAPAWAGSSVTPLAIDLHSARETGEVNLWNGSDRPMLVQADVVSWAQTDGVDVQEESDDFTIAPVIVEIPPKSGQVFRVRHRGAFPATELAYRLRLEDVTPPQASGGVVYRVRHDLPLMMTPPGSKANPIVESCPGKSACVQVRNNGSAHVKVTSIGFAIGGKQQKIQTGGTVLANSWKQWPLPRSATAGGQLQVVVETPSGPVTGQWSMPVK